MSGRVCVIHVKKGEPVTLCTRHTTTPATIPQGKHVIHVSKAHWKIRNENGDPEYLYTCVNDNCTTYRNTLKYDYLQDVNESCLTINHVQNISTFISTKILQSNDLTLQSRRDIHFYLTYKGRCTSVPADYAKYVYIVYVTGQVSQGLHTLSLNINHHKNQATENKH